MHKGERTTYQQLEALKSWRITKVAYWSSISIAIFYIFSFFIVGALIVAGIAYPLYQLIRRMYLYIQGIPNQTSKASNEKKKFFHEVAIVFLLMIGVLLLIGLLGVIYPQ